MSFDRQQADFIFNSLNNRQPAQDILETQFGVPRCAVDLATEVLDLLPGKPLTYINKQLQAGKRAAQEKIKEIKREIYLELGIIEVQTEAGNISLQSEFSDSTLGAGVLDFVNGIAGIAAIAGEVWGTISGIIDKVEQVIDCLDQLGTNESLKVPGSKLAKDYASFAGYCKIDGSRTNEFITEEGCVGAGGTWVPGVDKDALEQYDVDFETKYAPAKAEIVNALRYIGEVQNQQNNINRILTNRQNDPENYPEPCYDGSLFIPSSQKTVAELLEGTDFCVVLPSDKGFCSLGRKYTDKQSCELAGGVWTDKGELDLPQTKFSVKPERLDPPVSLAGKFILTETGIYYDTAGGGLTLPENLEDLVHCSAVVPDAALKYMFKYNPNCGGRGETVSIREFNDWANTIFDIESDTASLEEDSEMQDYFKKDTFLQQIIGEMNRHVYDLSSHVVDLLGDGYADDSALVINQRQSIQAALANYQNKVLRRKKQIQIAAFFGDFEPGKVPVNDFSFLTENNVSVSIDKQSPLMFNPGEVSSVVLPIDTKFGINKDMKLDSIYIDHLVVPSIGKGSIITNASAVDASTAPTASLTDNITKEDLIACYNFLEGDFESAPDSSVFNIVNTSDDQTARFDAQLVASSFDSVFPSGVGIPYFRGICSFFSGAWGSSKADDYSEYATSAQLLQSPRAPLSYVKLPSRTDDFDSLMYRNSGFSIDFWVHSDTIDQTGTDGWDNTLGASSLHRVVLGNENRGGDNQVTDVERFVFKRDLNSVAGVLVGFTRDRRFTKNLPPSNLLADNPIDNDLKFYLAPTVSVNTSSIEFIPANSLNCFGDSSDPQRYLGIVADLSATTASNYKLGDVSSSFMHVSITADPNEDDREGRVTIFVNGEELKQQNFTDTFGDTRAPQLPSPVDSSSFSYNNIFSDVLAPTAPSFIPSAIGQSDFWHWDGPGAGGLTPWIIGGGYSDGMTSREFGIDYDDDQGMNFLGGKNGGLRSGLNGHLGSFKLYKRALTSAEVLKNYNAQKGFFENIDV